MKKELRRQRKEARRQAAAAAQPAPPIITPPEGIPILWVEPTGAERYRRGYHCPECKAYTEQDMPVGRSKPGQTSCNVGAGSIQTGRWHGFLHGGRLVGC